ncbi:MAG: hypothetical protein Q4B50_06300, partial [Bacillota bacterium]|nr:hypothetical protein [Bacillota bacterium]
MLDLALLINEFTLFYLPASSPRGRLPQALSLLPLLAALSGGLLWAAAWVLYPGFFRISAMLLLGLDLLCGGFYIVKECMLFVDRRLLSPEQKQAALARNPFSMAIAICWLLLLYGAYFEILRSRCWELLFFAQVYSRWLFCFTVRALPVARESSLRYGFSAPAFLFASICAALFLLPAVSWKMAFSAFFSAGLLFLLLSVLFSAAADFRQHLYCSAA